MIGWILLALAVGLFLVGMVREGFAATPAIKAPPYSDAEAMRIFNMMSTADQEAVIETRRQNSPVTKSPQELKKDAARHVATMVEWFFVTVYTPAKVPITPQQIDAMPPGPGGQAETQAFKNILKTYFVGGVGTSVKSGYADALASLGQTVGYGGPGVPGAPTGAAGGASAAAGPVTGAVASGLAAVSARLPTPEDPCGTVGRAEVRNGTKIRVYTKDECDTLGGTFSSNGECSKKTGGSFTWDCRNVTDTVAGGGVTAVLAGAATGGRLPTPEDPCGTVGRAEVRNGTKIRIYTKDECDTLGGTFSSNGECSKKTGGSFTWDCRNVVDTPVASVVTPPTPGTGAAPPPTTGRTAGGTPPATSPAPTTGGAGKGTKVFGPIFTSLGSPIHDNGGDSTRSNTYPELLGGGDPSAKKWMLSQSGALPSTASLGSDPNSGFLPFSRTPGDQEVIPDPYRMSRNYSTSSYSSKTDPVPFLTDFSAFSK